jgi:hypothetical protein
VELDCHALDRADRVGRGAVAAVVKFWGSIMAFLKSRREDRIKEMIRKIETMEEQEQAKYPGKNIEVQIVVGPDDDPEIFREAERRIREKRKAPVQPQRFKPPWR